MIFGYRSVKRKTTQISSQHSETTNILEDASLSLSSFKTELF
jgi:hypothetical protein